MSLIWMSPLSKNFTSHFFPLSDAWTKPFNPFPNNKFRRFQTEKKFADGNFKFDVNGRKFSKRVENTVGKGELLVTSDFSFPTVFSKDLYCRHMACLEKD